MSQDIDILPFMLSSKQIMNENVVGLKRYKLETALYMPGALVALNTSLVGLTCLKLPVPPWESKKNPQLLSTYLRKM